MREGGRHEVGVVVAVLLYFKPADKPRSKGGGGGLVTRAHCS